MPVAAAPTAVFSPQTSGLLVTTLDPKESSKEVSSADGTEDSPKKSRSKDKEMIGLALLGGVALLAAGGGGGSHSSSAAPAASPGVSTVVSNPAHAPVFTSAPGGTFSATGISVTAPSPALPPSEGAAAEAASSPVSSSISGGSLLRTPLGVGASQPGGISPTVDAPEPSAWVSLTLGAFGLTMLAARRRRVRA